VSCYPLFKYFPQLASLAPIPQCELPTAVNQFTAANHLWVKRDDQTRRDQGGNKPRKLDFVLADIRRLHANRVITFGATGTNAGVATALMCQRENLHCHIITFPQPVSNVVRSNSEIMQQSGAIMTQRSSLFSAALSWYLHPRRLDPKSYFLYPGCSAPVATFAYINAMFELDMQISAGALPAPDHIVVAAGSGATVAGIAIGAALLLPHCRVHAVQVAPAKVGLFNACHPDVVASMIQRAWRTLQQTADADARFAEALLKTTPIVQWHNEWLGKGYGETTTAAALAIQAAAEHGLTLEMTYSGKAFAAALAMSEQQAGKVLFWNTYSPAALRGGSLGSAE